MIVWVVDVDVDMDMDMDVDVDMNRCRCRRCGWNGLAAKVTLLSSKANRALLGLITSERFSWMTTSIPTTHPRANWITWSTRRN